MPLYPGCSDHPHARGENASPRSGERPSARTIPTHVGRTDTPELGSTLFRTIPTHVGRTASGRSPRTTNPDHPHARGENDFNRGLADFLDGPSPRTWGELARA